MNLAVDSHFGPGFQNEHNAFEGVRVPVPAPGPVMSGPEDGYTLRLGGVIFAGAALLSAGAIALQWPMAPALLRNPFSEVLFVGLGIIVLGIGLGALAVDRRKAVPRPLRPVTPAAPSSEPSLMALPAIVGSDSTVSPAAAPPELPERPQLPAPHGPGAPIGLSAANPTGSTLLIPFSEEPGPSPASPGGSPLGGKTVSRLVDRMDALQRVGPAASSSPRTALMMAVGTGTLAPPLRLQLTRVPSPPAPPTGSSVARRCSDCGEALGSPPQFEPCADCGRALCERCYWRTSSGPRAHLCTTCFRDRSVPRPPTPAVTFARSAPRPSTSAPSERPLQPRRPVS